LWPTTTIPFPYTTTISAIPTYIHIARIIYSNCIMSPKIRTSNKETN
jgi:hypothetical protein